MKKLYLVTAYYQVKSKFDNNIYIEWIKNFLSIINKNFKLFIFTNKETFNNSLINILKDYNGKDIKIIFKEFEDFYTFKFRDLWIENQKKNIYLSHIDWKLQMLYSEKISFVNQVYCNEKSDELEWLGWCDIGYFRNRVNLDTKIEDLKNWGNINKLNNSFIYYGLVNPNNFNNYKKLFVDQNMLPKTGLLKKVIPHNQVSIAGGFFLIYKTNIQWWYNEYFSRLESYLINNYLVKDDQIIILDCIIRNLDKFSLVFENTKLDNWFVFQRYLI
jgi:hypothetical protein